MTKLDIWCGAFGVTVGLVLSSFLGIIDAHDVVARALGGVLPLALTLTLMSLLGARVSA